MSIKHSCPNEVQLSQLFDNELSIDESRLIHQHLAVCASCAATYEKIKKTSEMIQGACSIILQPEEGKTFETTLHNRIENIRNHPPTLVARLFLARNPLAFINWQWKTAAAMILFLFLLIPFLPNDNQGSKDFFMPPLASDFSDAKIFLETDPNAGYDMIWVVTEEEEKEESTDSPLGFVPLITV